MQIKIIVCQNWVNECLKYLFDKLTNSKTFANGVNITHKMEQSFQTKCTSHHFLPLLKPSRNRAKTRFLETLKWRSNQLIPKLMSLNRTRCTSCDINFPT